MYKVFLIIVIFLYSFVLLLPRAILSDPLGADYEHYIHDAHRNYQMWLDMTAHFNWPSSSWEGTAASSTHSFDSRPEADHHMPDAALTHLCCLAQENNTPAKHCSRIKSESCKDCFSQKLVLRSRDLSASSVEDDFDEGPFFRMLFKLLVNMPNQPYHVNLHLTSIILKLALMPHPNLHEYLLNPMLPTANNTRTLFKCLQELTKKLTMEIPRVKNYKLLIESTRLQLMSEDPSYDESGDHNTLVESLVVLEEFCKELAAVAFVKHQHANAHR